MITRVSKYQTTDGKLFNSEIEARTHEIEYEATKELAEVLRVGLATADELMPCWGQSLPSKRQ